MPWAALVAAPSVTTSLPQDGENVFKIQVNRQVSQGCNNQAGARL